MRHLGIKIRFHMWFREVKRRRNYLAHLRLLSNILLFNFCEQKFVQHGSITIAIDCNGLSLLIFEEK